MKKTKKKKKQTKPRISARNKSIPFGPQEPVVIGECKPESVPFKYPTAVVLCDNRQCSHCKQSPGDRELFYCNKHTIKFKKTWNGAESDWKLICLYTADKPSG